MHRCRVIDDAAGIEQSIPDALHDFWHRGILIHTRHMDLRMEVRRRFLLVFCCTPDGRTASDNAPHDIHVRTESVVTGNTGPFPARKITHVASRAFWTHAYTQYGRQSYSHLGHVIVNHQVAPDIDIGKERYILWNMEFCTRMHMRSKTTICATQVAEDC